MSSSVEIKQDHVVSSVFWDSDRSNRSNLSAFDNKLLSAWRDAATKGYFRYLLNIQRSIVLPGKWNFYAELNLERGENRRKPQEFFSVNEPFNPDLFNFTRIKDKEIILKIQTVDDSGTLENNDVLAINVSPIQEGHSLLLPCVNRMYPQALTLHSIELGLHILLMSSAPSFRLAFNSLCGFASVNHLHLHCLYINQPMKLESMDLQLLEGPCFQLTNYPGKGFAFQCKADSEEDVKNLSRNVFKLTSFLQSCNEAHNLVMTRSKLQESDDVLEHIRVFVWVRTPNTGAKEVAGFNPAALELFGYFAFKNMDSFENANEASISEVLEALTEEPFERNRARIQDLFKNVNNT